MKFLKNSLLLAVFAISTTMVFGQEEAAKQDLLKALGQLEKSTVSFTGKVSEEQPTEDSGLPFAGAQRIVVSSMSGGTMTTEFKGDIEVLAGKDDVAIVSKDEFPGVKILQSGEKTICIQAHADEPFGVKSLTSTVGHLVNWAELGQAVQKSKKIRVTKEGSDTSLRVVLDGEFIPVDSPAKEISKKMGAVGGGIGANVAVQVAGVPSMTPEIVDLSATFVLGSSNELKSVEYSLQYSDPLKAMMAQAMRGGGGIRIGGNAPKPKNDGEVELGKLVTYTFSKSQSPTDRMADFVKYSRELLKK